MSKTFLMTASAIALTLAALPAMAGEHTVTTSLDYMEYEVKLDSDRAELNYRGVTVEMAGSYDSGVAYDLAITSGNFYDFSSGDTTIPVGASAEAMDLRVAYHVPGVGFGPAISYESGKVLGVSDDVMLGGLSAATSVSEDLEFKGHLLGEFGDLDNFYRGAMVANYSATDALKLHAEANHIGGSNVKMNGLELGATIAVSHSAALRGDVIFQDGWLDLGNEKVDVQGVGVKAGVVFSF